MEEVAGLGVAITLLFVGVFLLMLHHSLRTFLLPVLQALQHPTGSFLRRAALWPLARAAAGTEFIINYVDHRVSVSASHAMTPLARWFSGLAAWITTLAYTAGDFAAETAGGFERLVTHTIPHEIHVATRPLWRGIDHLERDLTRLRETLRAFERGIDRLVAHRILPAIRALEHSIAVTIPRELGRIRSRVGTLEHDLTHPSRAWLKRLATSLWGVALLGLLLRTLARRFPWLFCRKVSSVGKRVCGLDQDLLNALIAETLLVAGTISIVQLAEDLQKVEGFVANEIHGFIRDV